jgi:hypothetical protein
MKNWVIHVHLENLDVFRIPDARMPDGGRPNLVAAYAVADYAGGAAGELNPFVTGDGGMNKLTFAYANSEAEAIEAAKHMAKYHPGREVTVAQVSHMTVAPPGEAKTMKVTEKGVLPA